MSDSNVAAVNVQETVEEIWCSVLGEHASARDATFFELGGESIAAVRIVSQVEEQTGVLVDVGDIFELDPTLPGFLRMVTDKAEHAA